MEYSINPRISDDFEDIKKLSSILNQKSEFDSPASNKEISEWEEKTKIKIPDMYRSWLMLTSYARIMNGRIELFFPEISTSDKEDVYIGSLGYGTDDLYFSKNTGAFYTIGDDEEEYEDFPDFLTYVYVTMEDEAEEEYGDDWTNIYDAKFGDD
jgi:hypothetical protein